MTMNRRSLLALPLALVAAPAVASTGVFAWVERLLAKRNVQLVPSKAPGLVYEFAVLDARVYPGLRRALTELDAKYAAHVRRDHGIVARPGPT
jgi:hypothetical protein